MSSSHRSVPAAGEVVAFELPDALVERIALRAAEVVIARLPDQEASATSPYLTIREAAELLRCDRQRIDDLLSRRRLTRVKEGRRTLLLRSEVDAYLVVRPRRSD